MWPPGSWRIFVPRELPELCSPCWLPAPQTGEEGEQPFTATALLGSADRPGFTSAGSVQV